MKILKKLVPTTIALSLVVAPMVASVAHAGGYSHGAKKTLSDGVTYGYAWTGYYGKNCYLSASIGSDSYEGWVKNWNQHNLSCDGDWEIYHEHDYE